MKILLVGAGGFGFRYVKMLLENTDPEIVFEGIVEAFSCAMEEEIKAAGVPVYKTLDEFYEKHTADLAIICTPAFMHKEHSIYCVRHGAYVLCEKPAAPTVADCEEMMAAEKETGKFIAIGYQRCFSQAENNLKKDILAGLFGKPISCASQLCAPRDFAYYTRGGGYAGNVMTKDGKMILDSPIANAFAHHLQEMMFQMGKTRDTVANVKILEAQCLRANDITNFDTACVKLLTEDGVCIYFAGSHATEGRTPFDLTYVFENATVTSQQGCLVAVFRDGTEKNYGRAEVAAVEEKFSRCVEAVKNGTVPVCTVKTATPMVRLCEDLYRTIPVENFPEETIVRTPERVYVPGLSEKILKARENLCLLSQL